YISLPPPFKSACGSRTLKTSKIYSRSKCVMECTTRKVIRQCGCRLLGLPDLPEYNGSKHCTPKEMFSCGIFDYPSSSEVKVSFLNALFKYFLTSDSSYSTDNPGRECDCPKTCTQIQHKIAQINVISLMSESFLRETFPFRETPNKDQEIRNLMTSF
ncbi:acid-sensing ion channel 2-like, partial [Exaiptasia diaphana]|uniref:Uncharacterized protein n=1 Tax=Exaiptasia diaphana TaxID=2652724 RepID=A0A913YHX2_EXADI